MSKIKYYHKTIARSRFLRAALERQVCAGVELQPKYPSGSVLLKTNYERFRGGLARPIGRHLRLLAGWRARAARVRLVSRRRAGRRPDQSRVSEGAEQRASLAVSHHASKQIIPKLAHLGSAAVKAAASCQA
jgi:hypothetical protein